MSDWSDTFRIDIRGCKLEISVEPETSGEVIPSPKKIDYNYNEEIYLTAKGNFDYIFDFWNDTPQDTSSSKMIKISKDTLVTAHFKHPSKVQNEKVNLPKNYFLYQNYPNPFNSKTVIKYQLPEEGIVTLSIYNIDGQLIRVLFNNYKQPGFFSTSWNAQDNFEKKVPSGIYFCYIQINEYHELKKMILTK